MRVLASTTLVGLAALAALAGCAELEPVRTIPAVVDPASTAAPEPTYRPGPDALETRPAAASTRTESRPAEAPAASAGVRPAEAVP